MTTDSPVEQAMGGQPKLPPPRKPFEEMTRDEMIVAYAYLRASVAEYIKGCHEVHGSALALIEATKGAPLSEAAQKVAEQLMARMGVSEK